MSVTITACANSTPPAGTIIATCTVGGEEYQLFVQADTAGKPLGISGSPVHVALTNSPSVIVSSGSIVVTNSLSASISNTLTASAIQSGAWAVTASLANSPSVVVSSGSIVVTNALSASISNLTGSAAGSPTFVSVTNLAGSAAGSPLFVTQNNMAGSAAGSPIFSSITNIGGSAAGSPLFVSACVTNLAGSAAGSPLFTSITNLAGSAAGSPLFVTQNNMTGSAAGSPTFASITNLAGSAAGSPLFVSACVTNSTGSAAGSPTFVKITDGTDTVAVNAASQLSVAVSSASVTIVDGSGNVYGVAAASPLYITGGAAGGTSATDKASYAEGTTTYTPIGGFYSTNPVALTACQAGALRLTANRAAHVSLRDESGNVLGVTGSPLIVGGGAGGTSATDKATYAEGSTSFTPAGGFYSTNPIALTACQSGAYLMTANRAVHSNLRDSGGNELGSGTGSPLYATATVTNALSASISGGSVALLAGANTIGAASAIQSGAWSVSASIVNSPSVIISSGSVVVTNALSASISGGSINAGSVIVTNQISASISNFTGSAAGSPTFVSACITNLAGSAAGSPLFVVATNLTGSAAGSPLFTSTCITNLAGSAAGSPLYFVQTNQTGSAAGSPTFTSITNLAGSAAGSPLFVSACITNRAGSAAGSPLYVDLTDGTDSAEVDSASRLRVAVSDSSGNVYGLSGSPFSTAGEGQKLYWAGSYITIQQANVSASTSGCTRIVASTSGQAIVIVNATYTTSSCQFIGWIASGAGAASTLIQTAMPFGTFGGMDVKRAPDSYLWSFPSGSNAIITTTSACNVAGTINYISVAS